MDEIKEQLQELYAKDEQKKKLNEEKLIWIDELKSHYGIPDLRVENVGWKSLEEIEKELHDRYGMMKYQKAATVIQKVIKWFLRQKWYWRFKEITIWIQRVFKAYFVFKTLYR